MYQKVEEVKRPLKIGEKFLVPCIIKKINRKTYISPIINHPHNDKENGQQEIHYHVDYRFVKCSQEGFVRYVDNIPYVFNPVPVNNHSKHIWVPSARCEKTNEIKINYYILPVINAHLFGSTPIDFIKKSKLKHDCIYKGKCPHRGYDLSQVDPIDGIITCPLHGLQFDSITHKIINNDKRFGTSSINVSSSTRSKRNVERSV